MHFQIQFEQITAHWHLKVSKDASKVYNIWLVSFGRWANPNKHFDVDLNIAKMVWISQNRERVDHSAGESTKTAYSSILDTFHTLAFFKHTFQTGCELWLRLFVIWTLFYNRGNEFAFIICSKMNYFPKNAVFSYCSRLVSFCHSNLTSLSSTLTCHERRTLTLSQVDSKSNFPISFQHFWTQLVLSARWCVSMVECPAHRSHRNTAII